MKKHPVILNGISLLLVIVFIVIDVVLWRLVLIDFVAKLNSARDTTPYAYFLDVGYGDAEAFGLPGNVTMLIDAGPDNKIESALQKVLPQEDKYIDLAIISSPDRDDIGGYNYLLDHYSIGAFIYDGRSASSGVKEWPELLQKIKERNIPLITLGEGDGVYYGGTVIDILSPDADFSHSADVDEAGFVSIISTPTFKEFLTANSGTSVENFLLNKYSKEITLHADMLKIPDHGLKDSLSADFLKAVSPRVAVIETGSSGHAGQPSKDTLATLASSSKVFLMRTDHDGMIKVWVEGGKLRVEKL